MQATIFCIWRRFSDLTWQRGSIKFPKADDPDGSEQLLAAYDGKPSTYREWAIEYYEVPVVLAAVTHVFDHKPLTDALVKSLNASLSLSDIADDMVEIGYP